ncbi:MAG: hypothetical protein M1820_002134 [Bogoriella megaspora]|nr:MAG: hypothetical protein M1820_002134 [Bogoriella megaspora]
MATSNATTYISLGLALSSILGADLKVESLARGHSHEVFLLIQNDGTRWSLRVARNEFAAELSKRGMTILKHIKQVKPWLQVPAVFHEAERYTILEYIQGDVLGSWNTHRLNAARRKQLLHSLAGFLLDLWTCPTNTFTAIDGTAPVGRLRTYRDWLMEEADKAIRRSIEKQPDWGDPLHFLSRRMKVAELLPKQDTLDTAIKHGDLNAWNVLLHENQIAGIIDWDTAVIVPSPAAVWHPLFIADIPGWQNDDVPEGMTFEDDREYLENEMRSLATRTGKTQEVVDLLVTSYERQFFELSLRNKRINKEYVRQRLENVKPDSSAVLQQLAEFLSRYESMRSHPTVLDLATRLAER